MSEMKSKDSPVKNKFLNSFLVKFDSLFLYFESEKFLWFFGKFLFSIGYKFFSSMTFWRLEIGMIEMWNGEFETNSSNDFEVDFVIEKILKFLLWDWLIASIKFWKSLSVGSYFKLT